MPTRPILDQNPGAQPNPTAAHLGEDSPLASQLPSWDLLPAHTMLVRRRPAQTSRHTSTDGHLERARQEISTDPPVVTRTASPVSAGAQEPAGQYCRNCGTAMAPDAVFCGQCGARLSR
jgi:hypothetical protein